MNSRTYKISVLSLLVLLFSGCSKFEEINTNPDKPLVASAPWLATNLITSISSSTISSTKGFTGPYQYGKYVLWTERKEGTQYNNLGRVDFSGKLTLLRNIKPMLEYAKALSQPENNSYQGLASFVRAWQFFQLTMAVGDIPYSEAIKGNEGIIKPKYDSQKDVFKGIISELDQANTFFASGGTFAGDFIYKGDADKWRRLVNSFELYVLLNLDKKTAEADLNVAAKFKEVASRPLMRDFKDNFAVTYNGAKGYCYPWSNTQSDLNPFTQYLLVSSTYIDLLKENNDRRLFYVVEPAKALLAQGKSPSSFDAYIGVEPSDEYNVMIDRKNSNMYSDINKRYVESATAEPASLFSHWDVEFMLAEAAVRGWISDDAQSHYAKGIKSSMNFYATYGSDAYNHGVKLDQSYIDAYPQTVELTGTAQNKIKQIISQKYMAGLFHNGFQAWLEFRRTGYPAFKLNPNSNANPTDKNKFPTRWQYPQNEINYNTDNLNDAVKRQYGGSDDFNGIMWLLK